MDSWLKSLARAHAHAHAPARPYLQVADVLIQRKDAESPRRQGKSPRTGISLPF
jgi:hypothetical protein